MAPPRVDPTIKRTRSIWRGMWKRCTVPTHPSFPTYGARGVTVCERWRDFDAFLADMGPVPAGGTIDRIDSSRGYEPANCRWCSPKDQARNRSSNVRVEWQGESLPIAEWAERLGLDRGTLWRRLQRGAPLEVVMRPALQRGRPLLGKQKPRQRRAAP